MENDKTEKRLINALKWAAGLFLVFIIVLNLLPLFYKASGLTYLPRDSIWPDKPFQHLPELILNIAAFVGLLTYELQTKKTRSEFIYHRVVEMLQEVIKLLGDRNNDRVIWIRAARSLLKAQKLSKEIELPVFKKGYQIQEERFRNELFLILTLEDENQKHRVSLPSQFFYGLPSWQERVNQNLDQVAIEASTPIEVHEVTLSRTIPEPPLYPLNEKSICAIFNFLKDSLDDDPLNDVQIWSEESLPGPMYARGAHNYIVHRMTYRVIAGQLIRRRGEEGEGNGTQT